MWLWSSSDAGALENVDYPFIAIAPRSTGLGRALSMGQIELNCVLMLNWITWNRTVFHIETVFMLNWIV